MLSTQYLTENYNIHSATFTAAKLAYRAASGICDDVTLISTALPLVLRYTATIFVWLAGCLHAAIRFTTPGAILLVRATLLTAVPALAMFAVLTIPGLPLCLTAFALFVFGTWAVTK